MFVMGGALLVALPGFQFIKRSSRAPPTPLCADKYSEQADQVVDGKLVAGGALFGAGWGLSGM